ncbi:hypothetical protein [Cupriavidus lacunae]|uniref:Twin-arginine translocation pathway signal n=1 Tax=Cupriavidus lacunae TaxID=2666307 RepID=A0A370NKY9_9BURK|nr:hypothetical protein [Cupriavidus lacunae]RDK06265.1 hypothetical protein DN412_32285 [Cupriavidus lacunae]
MGFEDIRMSRRSLLIATGSAAALAAVAHPSLLAAHAAISASVEVPSPSDIRYIVMDRRYPQSLAYAKAQAEKGGKPLEVTDGLTRLWQEHLHPLWQQGEGAVAGLTTLAVWQCLAEQARSHAFRTRVLTPLADNDGHPDNLASWIIA